MRGVWPVFTDPSVLSVVVLNFVLFLSGAVEMGVSLLGVMT